MDDKKLPALGEMATDVLVPVRAVIDGSPVLARRLVITPLQNRRKKAAAERAELEAERAEALGKLSDDDARKALAAAHKAEDKAAAAQAAADRKKAASNHAWTIGLVLFVGGPICWHYVRPVAGWIGFGAAVLWSVGAMIHAPESDPEKTAKPGEKHPSGTGAGESDSPAAGGEPDAPHSPAKDDVQDEDDDEDGEWIQADPEPDVLWALIRHAASLTKQRTAAHLQAVLDHGQAEGEFDGWTVTDLRQLIEGTHRIPVVDSKKLTVGLKKYNRVAVLLEHLPDTAAGPRPGTRPGCPLRAPSSGPADR